MEEKFEYEDEPRIDSGIRLDFEAIYKEIRDKLVKLYLMHIIADEKLFKKCCKSFFNVTTKEGAMSEKLLGDLMVTTFSNIKSEDKYNAFFLSVMKLYIEEFWMVNDQNEHDDLYSIYISDNNSEDNRRKLRVPLESQARFIASIAKLIDLDLQNFINRGDTLTGVEKLLYDSTYASVYQD